MVAGGDSNAIMEMLLKNQEQMMAEIRHLREEKTRSRRKKLVYAPVDCKAEVREVYTKLEAEWDLTTGYVQYILFQQHHY
jgi:hypothetical protein